MSNLKLRYNQHKEGKVKSTSKRLPVKLIYYECFSEKEDAERNEKYYKTTKGREDLRKKIKKIFGDHSSVVEQAAHNRLVAGSNPAGPTKKYYLRAVFYDKYVRLYM